MPRNTSTVASAGAAGMPNAVRPRGERGLLDADATGDRRDVAEHARADLHHDELREVEVLVEREQAQAEQRGVDEVPGRVAAEELQRLLRVAQHRPDVDRGAA